MLSLDQSQKGQFQAQWRCNCGSLAHQSIRAKLAEFPTHDEQLKNQLQLISFPSFIIGLSAFVYSLWCWRFLGVSPGFITLLIVVLGVLTGISSCLAVSLMNEYWHRYVQLDFECFYCGHKFAFTFDATSVGKRMRCGLYTSKLIRPLRRSSRQFRNKMTLSIAECYFQQMTNKIDAFDYNCKHWANEFYVKITK